MREGVFIPRRDTGSLLNHVAGGRLFPGEHNRAQFRVVESTGGVDLSMRSDDGKVNLLVRGRFGGNLPAGSCFASLQEASDFFEPGAVGYSVTRAPGRLDGMELKTHGWRVEALQVDEVHSSYFSDQTLFLQAVPPSIVPWPCATWTTNGTRRRTSTCRVEGSLPGRDHGSAPGRVAPMAGDSMCDAR